MASIPERFLPVEPLIRQLVEERYPKLNTHPGSAIHDVFILPASVLYQRFRDTARVLQRNQSLKNYNLMLPEELDRLASNFLVNRRQGTQAAGVQRIYFNDVQPVNVETSALFTDVNGLTYRPVSAVRLTNTELAANNLPSTNEYYVDVPIVSEGVGSTYRAGVGQITQVTGVVGASRTENLSALSGGDDQESNSELYARLQDSLTNRELVKKDGIKSTFQEAFSGVKSVLVQGYGDPNQTRDVLSASAALNTLIPASFCQKVNLPLDENGNVQWLNTSGDEITAPVGGFVGAIYDLTGRDFQDLEVSFDGKTTQRVAIQEGYKVRFLTDTDPDIINNDYRVTRVETVAPSPNADAVTVLRLDRPLEDTSPVGDNLAKTAYTIFGAVYTDSFHVGGKVDVYVDTTAETSQTVVINAVPAVAADSDVGEIPLTDIALDDLGNSIFEDGIGFVSPVISITKVEQLDFINDDEVIRELIPDVHYAVVRADERSKFTFTENDLLVVRGSEVPIDPLTNQPSDVSVPLFVGQRLRVTYITNPDIAAIQEFVDISSQRDVTKDIKVYPPTLLNVDVELSYSGSATPEVVQTIIQDYINQLSFDTTLTASDIVTVLTHFGVDQVKLPVLFKARREAGNGRIEFLESEDSLTPNTGELFRADDTLSITQI